MKWGIGIAIGALAAIGLSTVPLYAANISSSVITTEAVLGAAQRDYRWYQNIDNLTPTVPFAAVNATITTPSAGSQVRLRMNVGAQVLVFPAGAALLLQYANASSGPWQIISATTSWAFIDNPGVADGQIIAAPVLPSSDVGQSYGESNPTAASPNPILPGQEGEWDFVFQNLNATTALPWYFRLIYASGTLFDTYERLPSFSAVIPATTTPPSPPSGGGGGGGSIVVFTPPPTTTASATPSSGIGIIIGKPPESPCDSRIVGRVDLSGDCRVDMTDLSILVYYYGKSGDAIDRYDFTDNGRVDLFDISVMMYYWTD